MSGWSDAVISFCLLQVQLLISEQDVENYKLIKSDLERLRTQVEKSELWVVKKSGSDKKKDKKDKKDKGDKEEKKEKVEFCYIRILMRLICLINHLCLG